MGMDDANWRPGLLSKFGLPNDADPWCLIWILREPISTSLKTEIETWAAQMESGPALKQRREELPKLESKLETLTGELFSLNARISQYKADLSGIGSGKVAEKSSE